MAERLRIPICATLLALTLTATAFAQASAPVSKHVEIYGQKIHYFEAGGSGPPVILIHGLGGGAGDWGQTILALASTYHVYAPDQIGFGQSDKPIVNYRVATLTLSTHSSIRFCAARVSSTIK
jgi:pimeloyl-ACP methyl ester carboxylesterase